METSAREDGTPNVAMLSGNHVIANVREQAMFMLDPEGRIASWNEGVGRILGWPEAEWIGQPVAVIFTPEDNRDGVPQAEMHTASASGRADDDRWLVRRNGERFYALGELTRMQDADGRMVGYLKVLRDFTAQRQSARELDRLLASESGARAWAENQSASLTAAFEAIADGVCVGDESGFKRCNAAVVKMFGAGGEDELQLDLPRLIERFRIRRERDGPLLGVDELPFSHALGGRGAMLELWATHRTDGHDVLMRWAAEPIRVEGRVAGAVVVLGDLTERLELDRAGRALSRAQHALQERDAELRALVEGVRDYSIFTISTGGIITSWHMGAELMKGYTAEEAIGMPFSYLFSPEDQACDRANREMTIAAETGVFKGEGQRMRKDGSRFEAAVVLTPLLGADGEIMGFLKLTQDITERKRMESEREAMLRDAQSARAEAERANHSKGEFLATISHELRTPLSAILGWAHVLERGVFDPDTVKHGLTAISRNARIQVQLIEDLLDMNRIESGQLRLDLQRIELGGVIAAAIDSALPAATAKGIGLRTVFGAATGAVLGDAARLQQVVGNLLSNAIKFTPAGGQVSVALTQWGDSAQIAVADTGQGIEPDFIERMFHRFQQQDASTTRRHGGLGIGLAIVRHLVQLHGGTVRAHSLGSGLGSTFTVTLPAANTGSAATSTALQAAARTAPLPEDEPERLDGVSVLLVDDEADVRAVTARVLQDSGARVLTAGSARQALELLRRERPHVIVSDIGMPVMDGYDLMRRVREMTAAEGGHTPAAAFTAYTRPEDRQLVLEAGFQAHLAKPVPPATLVRAVLQLVQQGATGQALKDEGRA